MPEGPEVEIMRRTVDDLSGETLTDIDVSDDRLLGNTDRSSLRALIDETLTDVDRHGKYLLFQFETRTLIYHPRMTGLPYRHSVLDEPHEREQGRLVFESDTVILTSIRRFSRLDSAPNPSRDHPPLNKLGPDILTNCPDRSWFIEQWEGAGQLKPWLLDQTNVAGVGNIYANDIAFEAKLHPLTNLSSASSNYFELYESIPAVLNRGLDQGGASISDFESPNQLSGRYQETTPVYQRAGESCRECDQTIERLNSTDRPTFYCPNCQS